MVREEKVSGHVGVCCNRCAPGKVMSMSWLGAERAGCLPGLASDQERCGGRGRRGCQCLSPDSIAGKRRGVLSVIVVVHGFSCSTACGIFPDQLSNPCPLHWQADSYLLYHQKSLNCILILNSCIISKRYYDSCT